MKNSPDDIYVVPERPPMPAAMRQNPIFQAFLSAYAHHQEFEVCAATESIMCREKEFCQMVINDIQGLGKGGGGDKSIQPILNHYQARLKAASEKELILRKLSEDAHRLHENYRKKSEELSEATRALEEVQATLLAMKMLSKKENELRLARESLQLELAQQRQAMLDGLYEVVIELSGGNDAGLGSKSTFIRILQDVERGDTLDS